MGAARGFQIRPVGWRSMSPAGRAGVATDLWSERMRASQRIRRAALPAALAAVIGVGGFAVGAAAAGPGDTVRPAAATARSGQAAGYADVVRDVLPSVVLAGTETPGTTELAEVLASKEPGQVVSLTVTRDGADHAMRLTLGELPGA